MSDEPGECVVATEPRLFEDGVLAGEHTAGQFERVVHLDVVRLGAGHTLHRLDEAGGRAVQAVAELDAEGTHLARFDDGAAVISCRVVLASQAGVAEAHHSQADDSRTDHSSDSHVDLYDVSSSGLERSDLGVPRGRGTTRQRNGGSTV